jgi:hypothetical protein
MASLPLKTPSQLSFSYTVRHAREGGNPGSRAGRTLDKKQFAIESNLLDSRMGGNDGLN